MLRVELAQQWCWGGWCCYQTHRGTPASPSDGQGSRLPVDARPSNSRVLVVVVVVVFVVGEQRSACGVRIGAPCGDVGGCRRSVLIFLSRYVFLFWAYSHAPQGLGLEDTHEGVGARGAEEGLVQRELQVRDLLVVHALHDVAALALLWVRDRGAGWGCGWRTGGGMWLARLVRGLSLVRLVASAGLPCCPRRVSGASGWDTARCC